MVVLIGHEGDARAMVVLLHLPGTFATTLSQVVGETGIAVPVYQTLFNHIGTWISQCIQEVGSIPIRFDNDCVIVWR